jgi:site-specific recombinase XerD
MTDRVREILVRRSNQTTSGALFPFDNFWMARVWERMREHLGLQDDVEFIPYALRHTCASRLVQRGVSLLVVKEWLGHTNVTTTQRYAHLSPRNLMEAVRVLNGGEGVQVTRT